MIWLVRKEDVERELGVVRGGEESSRRAAALDGGSAEESRCIDALTELKNFPVNYKILVDSQIGKHLRHITMHPQKKIQAFEVGLIEIWKNIIVEETTRNKNGNSENKFCAYGEVKKRPNPVKVEKAPTKPEIVKRERVEQDSSPRPAKMIKSDTSLDSNGPPKLTTIIKCNDEARDSIRKLLWEALCKVYDEAEENIRDEVEACDPVHVAVSVESVIFENWGRLTGTHKAKYRSIIFNLKDQKNPDFRRNVLLEHVKAESILTLTPEEMASDQRKMQNQQIKEKALFECERGGPPKATTNQFKCGRCRQRKCTYYQMQTRSADEPMTTFVTCVNCNHHWKFC